MLSRNVVKDIQSLRQKKFRTELKLFVAEGTKIVSELIASVPDQVEGVYATQKWIDEHSTKQSLPYTVVTEPELEKISSLETPSGVLAVVKQFTPTRPTGDGWVIYLDEIQDPGNLGTIVRLADWFKISDVVCSEGCADIYNPKTIQSTMGSIARVNVFYDGENWLQKQSQPIFATTLDGTSVYNTTPRSGGVLLVGNESRGISSANLALSAENITIPRLGEAESLNAAIATGIILSHLVKHPS